MNLRKSMAWTALVLLMSGCTSYRNSIYLRNDEVLDWQEGKGTLYAARIRPNDELTITVSTSDPEASAPFYRRIGQARNQTNATQGMENAKLLDYLVDAEGRIDFPVLGKLHVAGLTNRECEALIREKLLTYLTEEPNVTVRISNYKVSVLGEVNKPGTYLVEDEQITIFEALAEAGDMTLFSKRDDVQILREDSVGKRTVIHLDLTEADVALSPEYYLQQNDVVYVKPTKTRVRSNTLSSNSTFWVSLVGVASTIASLVIVALQ